MRVDSVYFVEDWHDENPVMVPNDDHRNLNKKACKEIVEF